MRNKTLASLLILCGSTAAFAAIPQGSGPGFQDIPQNNSAVPPPADESSPDTTSNVTPPPAEAPATPSTGDDQPPKPEPQR